MSAYIYFCRVSQPLGLVFYRPHMFNIVTFTLTEARTLTEIPQKVKIKPLF